MVLVLSLGGSDCLSRVASSSLGNSSKRMRTASVSFISYLSHNILGSCTRVREHHRLTFIQTVATTTRKRTASVYSLHCLSSSSSSSSSLCESTLSSLSFSRGISSGRKSFRSAADAAEAAAASTTSARSSTPREEIMSLLKKASNDFNVVPRLRNAFKASLDPKHGKGLSGKRKGRGRGGSGRPHSTAVTGGWDRMDRNLHKQQEGVLREGKSGFKMRFCDMEGVNAILNQGEKKNLYTENPLEGDVFMHWLTSSVDECKLQGSKTSSVYKDNGHMIGESGEDDRTYGGLDAANNREGGKRKRFFGKKSVNREESVGVNEMKSVSCMGEVGQENSNEDEEVWEIEVGEDEELRLDRQDKSPQNMWNMLKKNRMAKRFTVKDLDEEGDDVFVEVNDNDNIPDEMEIVSGCRNDGRKPLANLQTLRLKQAETAAQSMQADGDLPMLKNPDFSEAKHDGALDEVPLLGENDLDVKARTLGKFLHRDYLSYFMYQYELNELSPDLRTVETKEQLSRFLINFGERARTLADMVFALKVLNGDISWSDDFNVEKRFNVLKEIEQQIAETSLFKEAGTRASIFSNYVTLVPHHPEAAVNCEYYIDQIANVYAQPYPTRFYRAFFIYCRKVMYLNEKDRALWYGWACDLYDDALKHRVSTDFLNKQMMALSLIYGNTDNAIKLLKEFSEYKGMRDSCFAILCSSSYISSRPKKNFEAFGKVIDYLDETGYDFPAHLCGKFCLKVAKLNLVYPLRKMVDVIESRDGTRANPLIRASLIHALCTRSDLENALREFNILLAYSSQADDAIEKTLSTLCTHIENAGRYELFGALQDLICRNDRVVSHTVLVNLMKHCEHIPSVSIAGALKYAVLSGSLRPMNEVERLGDNEGMRKNKEMFDAALVGVENAYGSSLLASHVLVTMHDAIVGHTGQTTRTGQFCMLLCAVSRIGNMEGYGKDAFKRMKEFVSEYGILDTAQQEKMAHYIARVMCKYDKDVSSRKSEKPHMLNKAYDISYFRTCKFEDAFDEYCSNPFLKCVYVAGMIKHARYGDWKKKKLRERVSAIMDGLVKEAFHSRASGSSTEMICYVYDTLTRSGYIDRHVGMEMNGFIKIHALDFERNGSKNEYHILKTVFQFCEKRRSSRNSPTQHPFNFLSK
eukprot:Nk52_evm30s2325 gene=Nk52_evmTU30s2325